MPIKKPLSQRKEIFLERGIHLAYLHNVDVIGIHTVGTIP